VGTSNAGTGSRRRAPMLDGIERDVARGLQLRMIFGRRQGNLIEERKTKFY